MPCDAVSVSTIRVNVDLSVLFLGKGKVGEDLVVDLLKEELSSVLDIDAEDIRPIQYKNSVFIGTDEGTISVREDRVVIESDYWSSDEKRLISDKISAIAGFVHQRNVLRSLVESGATIVSEQVYTQNGSLEVYVEV